MNTPIVLAFISLICGGLATFFWKIAGRNQVYSPSYMVVETLVFCGVAIIIHTVQRHPFELSNKMTVLASMGGILAAISVYTILVAFRLGGQGSVIFPIISLGIVVSGETIRGCFRQAAGKGVILKIVCGIQTPS